MLGWHISIYRQTDDGSAPAAFDAAQGTRLAVWQTGLSGLDWIDDLVKTGKAIALGGNGYPRCYTATAENLLSPVVNGPPAARPDWVSEPNDILTEKWDGRTVIDPGVADCRPDEWLLVVAWDES